MGRLCVYVYLYDVVFVGTPGLHNKIPAQDFRQGLGCSVILFFIGSGYDFPGAGSEKTGIL